MKLQQINSKVKILDDSLENLLAKGKELSNNLDLLQKEYERSQEEYKKQRDSIEKDPALNKLNDDREAIVKAVSKKKESKFYLFLFVFLCFLVIRFFVSEGSYTVLLLFGSIAIGLIYQRYHSRKLKNDQELLKLEKKLKDIQTETRKYLKTKNPKTISKTELNKSKKFIGIKTKEIEKIQKEIEKTEQKLKSNISLRRFNKKYDKDNNQVLDIVETSKAEKIILHQQNKIRLIEKTENRNYINDLFKISSFLGSLEQMLQSEFKDIQKLGDKVEIKKEIKVFSSKYENYQTLLRSLFVMIASLMQDNLFLYYKLRDLFDKLSIFDSNFEKELVSEIRNLVDVTSNLQESINEISIDISLLSDTVDEVQDELLSLDLE